jgi:hypothetical protein
MKNTFARSIALGLGVVLVTSMALVSGSTATAGSSTTASRGVVAQSSKGQMTSRLVGTTGNGRQVTGKFTPLHFSRHNGHVRARGLLSGVVHNANGTTKTFSVMRTLRVRSINGAPATARAARTAASARATCPILHLVLGPLDLDLLGLQVHLDRVVLNVDAQSGPGNLLGNLLCAVAGLLDGGLNGLLGQLVGLLNRILGQLGLGL